MKHALVALTNEAVSAILTDALHDADPREVDLPDDAVAVDLHYDFYRNVWCVKMESEKFVSPHPGDSFPNAGHLVKKEHLNHVKQKAGG